ncbi:MAG: hypothetical protein R3F34_16235 [Planctomycetota bacterium]
MPLKPKLLTPQRRGPSPCGQGVVSRGSATQLRCQSTCGFGSPRCSSGGSSPRRSAATIFTSPTMPAAGSVWPTFVFAEPISSGRVRPSANTSSRAPTSIGSPSDVPVPCASTTSTSCGESPASRSAARMTSACAARLGTVSPLLAPSWLIAVPRTSACTRSPSRSASDRRFSSTTPAPSERTEPFARASKLLQRPSAASICAVHTATVPSGSSRRLMPAANAASHSPVRRLCTASCSATSDDEHAVSSAKHGPRSPSQNEMRPAIVETALPVA